MKVSLLGSTGIVGKTVLRQCLLDPDVESVLSIGRNPSGVSNPKLRDLVHADMFDFNVNAGELNGYDTCFFCLGVSSVGMSEAEYTHLTFDLTMGWAYGLARVNPAMRFLYVSGMGTGGKAMWARVKGRTENDLLALFPAAIMIRLGALRPNARRALEGARRRCAAHPAVASLAGPPMALAQRRHHDRGTRPRHDSRRAQRRIQARAGERRSGGLGAERHSRHEGTVRTRRVNEACGARRVPRKRSGYAKHRITDDERWRTFIAPY